MIDAGSTTLNNKWKNVLHNQAEDYIIPESDVNVMCPYDCLSTSGYSVSSYQASSVCDPNALASAPTTITRNKKVATFEWNFWVLDGSFDVLDDGETFNGYMSSNMSNEDCTFTINPYVFLDYLTFNQRKNQTIKFAPMYDEVPAEIQLFTAYGSTVNSLIFNIEEMLEQDDIQNQEYVHLYSDDIDTTFSASRVGITTRKTLMPYRRARVTEYNNGYKFYKDKNDLQTFNHTRTTSLNGEELPQNDLQISFTDLEGVYDNRNLSAPFHIVFNKSHRFYVYYGYNFDDIGWNYVHADTLCLNNVEINRDSIETTINLQSTMQLYTNKYPTQYLDMSHDHISGWVPEIYKFTTFQGLANAVCNLLNVSNIVFDQEYPPTFLTTSKSLWRFYLNYTLTSGGNFQNLKANEIIQQIGALLKCAIVRQPNGELYMKNLVARTLTIVDNIESANIISYPTQTKEDSYKNIIVETPPTYQAQEPDNSKTETVEEHGAEMSVYLPKSRASFTVNSSETEECTLTQELCPLGDERDSYYYSLIWTWHDSIYESYANHFNNVHKATRYEFGETMLNPLLQVADFVRAYIGSEYKVYRGFIEKIEINYDGSFKGALTICSVDD